MSTRTTSTTRSAPAAGGRDDGDRPSRRAPEATPRRSSPRVTVIAVLTALALGALLNGPGLVSAATGMDVGATRTVTMRLATLVADTGTLLRLDGPRRWLSHQRDRALGTLGATASDDDTDAANAQPAGPDSGSPVSDDASAPAAPAASAQQDATRTTDASRQAADRTRRTVTADEPLQVLFAGDSLIGTIADGFGRVTDGRETVRWTKDVRISTGLARPDVLDWHRHLEQLLADRAPDVVVLMLGGNDDQSLTGAPDGVIHLGQDGWEAEYERRVADLVAIAGRDDRLVVWLGLPAVRPDKLERTRPTMLAAAQRAIAGTEVVLFDTEPVISPGGYTARLDGVQVRADDGVHLSHDGGDRVAALLERLLADLFDLPAS